jgi:hypothetical protein
MFSVLSVLGSYKLEPEAKEKGKQKENTFTAHTGTTPQHRKTTQVNHLQNRKR